MIIPSKTLKKRNWGNTV